jgi:hypothetical protein
MGTYEMFLDSGILHSIWPIWEYVMLKNQIIVSNFLGYWNLLTW